MYREITIKDVVSDLVKAADELFAFGTSIESARNLARIRGHQRQIFSARSEVKRQHATRPGQ
jgi:hypothetical protein